MECECAAMCRVDRDNIPTKHHPRCHKFPEECKECMEEFGHPDNCIDCPSRNKEQN